MPTPALPYEPTRGTLTGAVPVRREYRDLVGRPMSGKVTIVAGARGTAGNAVVPAAPVTVELVGGVLDVQLLPGTYQLAADLRTVDGDRVDDVQELVLTV